MKQRRQDDVAKSQSPSPQNRPIKEALAKSTCAIRGNTEKGIVIYNRVEGNTIYWPLKA